MDYQQTLDYLYTQLPMFTRDGASAFKKDLTNTLALCELLDNPQHQFKSVHVGGTNGKGSTSHMLAAILQTAGYKTGLYTSPHLRDFRERIRINGEMIPEEDVVSFVADHQQDFERIQPSFFEMTVALAFDHFAKNKVDIAVIEVGLGGRLDSTNVITPLLSVITNIGWDHMNMLGNTLPLIAGEKAGIIKQNIPVIIGEYQTEVAPVFQHKAKEQNSPISFASELWETEMIAKNTLITVKATRTQLPADQLSGDQLPGDQLPVNSNQLSDISSQTKQDPNQTTGNQQPATDNSQQTTDNRPTATGNQQPATDNDQPTTSNPQHATDNPQLTTDNRPLTTDLDLTGSYQLKNLKTVLTAVDELRRQGFVIKDDHIRAALSNVQGLTGLHGRWETISTDPLTICDTGHNPEGVQEVLKNISTVKYSQLHFVVGVVNDKDVTKILDMLPKAATYYFCKPDIPRGLDADLLQLQAADAGLNGQAYQSVKEALAAAQKNATHNDLVFVGGSTFVVAEVI